MVSLESNGKLKGVSKWKEDLIMFELTNTRPYKFLLDPACDVGCITYSKVIPSDIRLVDPSEYKNLFRLYSDPTYRFLDGKNFRIL